MKLLIDTQLPRLLVEWLQTHDLSAVHLLDLGMAQSSDSEIWDYARQNDCIILTKDADFSYRVLANHPGPAVVWLHVGNCSNEELLQRLEPLLPALVKDLGDGERLIEIG